MHRVAEKIDPMVCVQRNLNKRQVTITSAVAKGTADVSEELGAKVIAVATQSGRAVRDMRRYFPEAIILGITNDEITANQMTILRGVQAYCDKNVETLESFFELAEKVSVDLGLVEPGDIVVATCGEKIFQKGTTNSVKVIKVK